MITLIILTELLIIC